MEKIIAKGNCVFCGKGWSVSMTENEYDAWRFGEVIQKALPKHTPEERECLISGMCVACQNKIFG